MSDNYSKTTFDFSNNQFTVGKDYRNYDRNYFELTSCSSSQFVELTERELFQLFMELKQHFEGEMVSERLFQQYINGVDASKWSEGFFDEVAGSWADMPDEIFEDESQS